MTPPRPADVRNAVAAEVDGEPITVAEVDAREAALRATPVAAALPRQGTSEGRQLRRWLTQVLVAERVVTMEAGRRGLTADQVPPVDEVLPDHTARVQLGSIPAALLDSMPLARALYAVLTADVTVPYAEVLDYYTRNSRRFAAAPPPDPAGWTVIDPAQRHHTMPTLSEVRPRIEAELTGAARRLTFARWLDAARADLVRLRPGYEHPGDPAQPDNTHRH